MVIHFGFVNNVSLKKKSLYLHPLFAHPPFQQIKPRKDINNESVKQNPNCGSRKDEADLLRKTIRPHADNEGSKIGFTW